MKQENNELIRRKSQNFPKFLRIFRMDNKSNQTNSEKLLTENDSEKECNIIFSVLLYQI